MAQRIPKGCWVRYVRLSKGGAEVSYDCGSKKRKYPVKGGFSTYPKARIPKIGEIITGAHGTAHTVGKGARVDFQLSPHKTHCKVRRGGHRGALVCTTRGKKGKR